MIEDDELVGEEKIEEEMGDPNSMLGSHGAQLGGESKLLCDQFHLHSPVMKKHQIVLLEVSVITCHWQNTQWQYISYVGLYL